jgi:hypothetical protein
VSTEGAWRIIIAIQLLAVGVGSKPMISHAQGSSIRVKAFWIAATLIAMLAVAVTASAQEARFPVTVGAEVSALGLDNHAGTGHGVAGFGGRADLGLTPRVELEGRVTWFPSQALQEFEAQGGQTLQVAAGIRGKFVTRQRATLYGVLLPGLVHFTNALSGADFLAGGATHFSLDSGLGLEVLAGAQWAVRAEVTGPLYFAPGVELGRSEPNAAGAVSEWSLAPRPVNVWQVSAGISYRLHHAASRTAEQPVRGRWEMGAQLAAASTTGVVPQQLRTAPAFGAFASYRLAPAVYADVALNTFNPRSPPVRSAYEGGRLTQALAGVKIGPRKDGFGFFVTTRVGVNSHAGAVAASGQSGLRLRRHNVPAVEVGGTLERYLPRGLVVRFDGTDVVSVIRATTIMRNGQELVAPGGPGVHSLQLAWGVGWRF